LRENRAATSGSGEMTIIDKAEAQRIIERSAAAKFPPNQSGALPKPALHRFSIEFADGTGSQSRKKRVAAIAALVVLVLVVGVALLVARSRRAAGDPNAAIVASPSPAAASPSPSPSPSPTASPKNEESPHPDVVRKPKGKKASTVGSIVKKVKRILKKPF